MAAQTHQKGYSTLFDESPSHQVVPEYDINVKVDNGIVVDVSVEKKL